LNHVPFKQIPLKDDFTIDIADYMGNDATIFIANPNAPTGILLGLDKIETILKANPDQVVVIDEAYVDFGGESAVTLIGKYENLLVTRTFSKSRSMAGARLGMAMGSKALIGDLQTLKYSTNPYNVNAMTMAAGLGSMEDDEYFRSNCQKVCDTRAWTTEQLRMRGFTVLDSCANFIFAQHPGLPGKQLYLDLKAKGILIRHFDTQRLTDYIRITIGSTDEMAAFVRTIDTIMEETL
jgi:histidinol-phosphate aminotransferase